MAMQVHIDETNCGPMCQHPQCWLSQTRQDKGFPHLKPRPPSPDDLELDLPTLKVCNMLDDYGDDPLDKFPAKFSGKPSHSRLHHSLSGRPRAPQTSPKSTKSTLQIEPSYNKFKVVEVQEVFDPQDLKGTWDDTFVPKSYYVWVPNMKKKRRKKKKLAMSEDKSTKGGNKHKVKVKDMTEEMIPQEIEDVRLEAVRKKRANMRSPTMRDQRQFTLSPTLTARTEGEYDGISELLDLPREILVQVLENTRQSDLMSRAKIHEIIRRFLPTQLDRGYTNMSLASQDLLQQKKLNLHQGNKNVRQPHLMETKPVFYMDDDVLDDELEDEDIQQPISPYGSLKDLYFGGNGTARDANKFKKPLPPIAGVGRAISAGVTDFAATSKLPSISLGLPELPSGIKHTKPFTYTRLHTFDFTLAPVPTPPTSVRSTATGGSDHGTTIRVNVPSESTERNHNAGDNRSGSFSTNTPEPMHAVSPTFSTHVPKAPATTPATNQLHSPIKSAPLLRDGTSSTLQDWPPRDRLTSPTNIRAPVNTPGSVMQENSGLRTIHEAGQDNENGNQSYPMSRGRSVRFEIPEVPPPPSSPQLSEVGPQQAAEDLSRNTVTVNTSHPQDTPSTNDKPMSGVTMRTDANTVNTSNGAENSFIRSQPTTIAREMSFAQSPEPWPQVNEADYEVALVPTPNTYVMETPQTVTTDQGSEHKSSPDMQSARLMISDREPVVVPSPDREENGNYGNKADGHAEAAKVKKLMEESQKSESPAPPPPSPEPKQDKKQKLMTPLMEEGETPHVDESEISVLQIAPKGAGTVGKKTHNRHIDTFQNIDIPATFDGAPEVSPSGPSLQAKQPDPETILEEPEMERDTEDNKETRDVALSAQSTLANRTISETGQSDVSSSVVEPAISQASQAPALSEDYSERRDTTGLLGDWTGVVVGSEHGPETTGMLSSEKLEMTEDGGDNEAFKDDLREEYDKMQREIDENQGKKETKEQ